MANAKKLLRPLSDRPPNDLVKHFNFFNFTEDAVAQLGLLTLSESIALSTEFRTFHPLAIAIGLVFLDDPNTSNYHFYITVGPLTGGILYLAHDDDTAVFFKGLANYILAATAAHESHSSIDQLHPNTPVLASDQNALANSVNLILHEENDEIAMQRLLVYIAAWDLSQTELLEKLARHSDMFVAESLGNAITKSPRRALQPIDALMSRHKHAQAARAG
ncbi:MAG: hypothetical protein K8T89_26280, partial [Planctomycetes bacterium]|nr:hypothetical protein [Planctomycetota bacterium]